VGKGAVAPGAGTDKLRGVIGREGETRGGDRAEARVDPRARCAAGLWSGPGGEAGLSQFRKERKR